MNTMMNLLLSLGVLAALLFGGVGAYILIKRPTDRRRGVLMIGVAIVTIVNVWLIAAPAP